MLPVAARLATIVHGDGGPEDVQAELEQLTATETTALIVVLAGLVDPDRPLGGVLGWLDFDENARPTVPDWDDRTTLRELAEASAEPVGEVVDEVAVRAYLAGRRGVTVTTVERLEAIRRGLAAGMKFADFDDRHGLSDGASVHFVTRARQRALERGEAFPDLPSSGRGRVFTEQEVVDIRKRSAAGATDLELAMAFDVRRQSIQRIVCGDSHPDVAGPIRPKHAVHPSTAGSRGLFTRSAA
jgi:hypothetical protein